MEFSNNHVVSLSESALARVEDGEGFNDEFSLGNFGGFLAVEVVVFAEVDESIDAFFNKFLVDFEGS